MDHFDHNRYVVAGLAVGVIGLVMGNVLLVLAGLALSVATIGPDRTRPARRAEWLPSQRYRARGR